MLSDFEKAFRECYGSEEFLFRNRIHFKGHKIHGYPVYWYQDAQGFFNNYLICEHPFNKATGLQVVHTWIVKRPQHCDRGAYLTHCDYVGLDAQDGLPKYAMHPFSLMLEMTEWLEWRFEHRKHNEDPLFNPPTIVIEDCDTVDGGCERDPQVVIETLKEIYRQHTATSG